jgi:hypothetical protein
MLWVYNLINPFTGKLWPDLQYEARRLIIASRPTSLSDSSGHGANPSAEVCRRPAAKSWWEVKALIPSKAPALFDTVLELDDTEA